MRQAISFFFLPQKCQEREGELGVSSLINTLVHVYMSAQWGEVCVFHCRELGKRERKSTHFPTEQVARGVLYLYLLGLSLLGTGCSQAQTVQPVFFSSSSSSSLVSCSQVCEEEGEERGGGEERVRSRLAPGSPFCFEKRREFFFFFAYLTGRS